MTTSACTLTLTAAAATVAATAVLGATAAPAAASPHAPHCLWAGRPIAPAARVYAGGWAFRCGTDNNSGGARWNAEGPSPHRDSVDNPGATGDPVGSFSPGAWQPGTDYDDSCVGAQLIEGTENIYIAEAVPGGMYWRSGAPISQWRFQEDRPRPTTRSASMCLDGVLS